MTKRIKILFTIPNFDTAGSGKVVFDLVNGLDKTQFEPEICCFHDRGAFFDIVKALGVPIHLFAFTTPYRPWLTFPLRVLKISRFFKQYQFDLIHSWHWSSDISEPLAAKLAGIPFVYTKKSMGWGSRFWTWRSKLSSRIVTINKDMVTEFFSKMSHKIEPIALGVDTQKFHPDIVFKLTHNNLHLKASDFVIITVANLVPIKGIEVLLESVKILNENNLKVLVIGSNDSDYGISLKNAYSSDTIHFIGKQIDVRPFLALANVFVIPTKEKGEGLPIAPLEAMASGKIVIGSNVSGIKDILEPFSEQLFEANSVDDLKSKLVHLKSMSDHERAALGHRMAKHVQQTYNIPQFISKHEALYLKLTS